LPGRRSTLGIWAAISPRLRSGGGLRRACSKLNHSDSKLNLWAIAARSGMNHDPFHALHIRIKH
jgi:hypothetical protein